MHEHQAAGSSGGDLEDPGILGTGGDIIDQVGSSFDRSLGDRGPGGIDREHHIALGTQETNDRLGSSYLFGNFDPLGPGAG